jgi:lipoate-protein ligase A
MEAWQLIVSPELSGLANMQSDLKLFNDFEKGNIPSTLRIYSWKPKCISVGYSQEMIQKDGWDVVKRPTGGGIVFHNGAEVTYSLVTDLNNPILPEGMIPSYKKISEAVVCGLRRIGLEAEISNQAQGQRPEAPRLRSGQAEGKRLLCFSYAEDYEIVVGGKKIVGSAQKRGKKALLQQGSICIEEVLSRKVDFLELSKALVKGFEECFGVKFA